MPCSLIRGVVIGLFLAWNGSHGFGGVGKQVTMVAFRSVGGAVRTEVGNLILIRADRPEIWNLGLRFD